MNPQLSESAHEVAPAPARSTRRASPLSRSAFGAAAAPVAGRVAGAVVVSLALALPCSAWAQSGADAAISADPELVNPRFGHNTIPGVPAPDHDVKNTVRAGLFLQYERNPVTGYRLDQELGPIVQNRLIAHLGVSWDFAKWGALRFVMPVAGNWGTLFPDLDASGFGTGDFAVGAGFRFVDTEFFDMGAQADLFLPTGIARFYMGERSVRASAGLMMAGHIFEWVDLGLNVGVMARRVIDTRQDFQLGPDLLISQGARLNLPWIPLSFVQALQARGGFTRFFAGGAENALEIMGGVQVRVPQIAFNTTMTIDVMAGRGTNQGYGTTDFRLVGGLTFIRNPGRKPRPEPVVVIEKPPPPPLALVIEEPPPEEWAEGEVAKRVDDQIVIRDQIQFFVDTPNIKPESLPVLAAVAGVLNDDYRILHLVIEGHASKEGDFDHNYALSRDRAEAIYRQLILEGVAPERLSYRGMGETVPLVEGEDEESLAINRRVEFEIVGQYSEFSGKDVPVYAPDRLAPWDGSPVQIKTPRSPADIEAEQRAKEEAELDKRRSIDRFEAEDDESDAPAPLPPKLSPTPPPAEEDDVGADPFGADPFGSDPFGDGDPSDEPAAPGETAPGGASPAAEPPAEDGGEPATSEGAPDAAPDAPPESETPEGEPADAEPGATP